MITVEQYMTYNDQRRTTFVRTPRHKMINIEQDMQEHKERTFQQRSNKICNNIKTNNEQRRTRYVRL